MLVSPPFQGKSQPPCAICLSLSRYRRNRLLFLYGSAYLYLYQLHMGQEKSVSARKLGFSASVPPSFCRLRSRVPPPPLPPPQPPQQALAPRDASLSATHSPCSSPAGGVQGRYGCMLFIFVSVKSGGSGRARRRRDPVYRRRSCSEGSRLHTRQTRVHTHTLGKAVKCLSEAG